MMQCSLCPNIEGVLTISMKHQISFMTFLVLSTWFREYAAPGETVHGICLLNICLPGELWHRAKCPS